MFLWNGYAASPLRRLHSHQQAQAQAQDQAHEGAGQGAAAHKIHTHMHTNSGTRWFVPFIQGFVGQKTTPVKLADETAASVKYTLIARRSARFAGTRYLRRGVSSSGECANEVETEQVVTLVQHAVHARNDAETYRSTSLVQLRASIPLYWHHTNLVHPQPGASISTKSLSLSLSLALSPCLPSSLFLSLSLSCSLFLSLSLSRIHIVATLSL